MMRKQSLRNNQQQIMLTEAVEKLIVYMAIPSILSMFITTLYNMTDTFFIGKISTMAVAAVGIAYSFMSIVQAFGFLFGHGSGNYISKMLGKKEIKRSINMASVGLAFSMGTGVVLAILCFFGGSRLGSYLGAIDSIQAETTAYLKTLAIGIPFMTGALTLDNQFRFQGKSFYGMLGIGAGGILNVILDPLLIFELNMGIRGAGLATAISQIFSFCLLLYLNKRCHNIQLSLKRMRPSKEVVADLLWGGMPNFSRQAIAALAAVCLNSAAASYGEEAIAAFTIVNRLVMVFGAVMIGFGQGFQPICAYNYGAGCFQRVKRAVVFTMACMTLFVLAVLGFMLLWGRALIELFSKQLQVLAIGEEILKLQCLSLPVLGVVIISGMFLQNIGHFKQATVVSASRQGICFLPLILILPSLWGLFGVMVAQPLADIGTFLIALPLTISAYKELGTNDKSSQLNH